MEGELAGLAGGSGEDAQGHQRQRIDTEPNPTDRGGFKDVGDMQRVHPGGGEFIALDEQVDDGNEEPDVANAGDDERLLGSRSRSRPVVPEPDEKVGRYADELPEEVELDDVAGQGQPQH